jgi:integrase
MTRFAAICGWRLGEVLGLTWESVDHQAQEIRLRDSKNGEGRLLPLEDEDWALIERRWAAREYSTPAGPGLSEYVFHRRGRQIPTSTFEKQWQVARKAAKLPGKLFHDLRRTAARDMVRGGAPESFAMKITGHKTRSMFERYNIVSTDDMREALRRRREHVAQPERPAPVRRISDRG